MTGPGALVAILVAAAALAAAGAAAGEADIAPALEHRLDRLEADAERLVIEQRAFEARLDRMLRQRAAENRFPPTGSLPGTVPEFPAAEARQ